MNWLFEFTRTLDKSNRSSSSSSSHLIRNDCEFKPKSEAVNGDMCVFSIRKLLNSVVSVCAHEKINMCEMENSPVHTHTSTSDGVKIANRKTFYMSREPNEND